MTIRRAMVLAAGRGTRLAPITDTIPKPLVPVAGRPFLEWILAFLRAGGITDVVVNLHHLGHRIAEHVGDGARFGVRVAYSWEDPILDTGGGIKRAEPLLAGEPFVVVNGDSLLEIPLSELLAFHRERGGVITMALRENPDPARYGIVDLDRTGRVRRVLGRPADVDVPLRPFMFPGLHVFEPGIFAWMDADTPFSVTRVTYPRVLAAGQAVFGWVTAARWINIDTPDALAAADAELSAAPFRI